MVLLMCGAAWDLERRALLRLHDPDSPLVKAMSRNLKEWLSLVSYTVAVGMAFVHTWIACAIYCVVAAMSLIPDRRIERVIGAKG